MTPDTSLEPGPPVRGQILCFLSWTGLTTASLGLVLSLDLFLLTYILHEDLPTAGLASAILLTTLYLTVNIALLMFSVKLRRLSDCQDIPQLKKLMCVLIKLYLIFKIVIYIMFFVSCVLFFSLLYPSGLVCLAFSNIFLVMTFYYLYSNGFVFVLYKLFSSDVIPDSVYN